MLKKERVPMNKQSLASSKVLIVDDEAANSLMLERLLEMSGFTDFRSTNDSEQAVQLFLEYQPDLVLLDLSMPKVDGFTVLKHMRSVIAVDEIVPILVLTADATEQAKQRVLSAGASDFVTKPFNNAEVILRVQNLLKMRWMHQSLQAQNERLECTVEDRTHDLREALQELHDTQQQVIQQERLHALGTMASGVAHDFNNSLAIILGFGELALMHCENAAGMEKASESIKAIIVAAEDGAKIVRRLRAFHRKERMEGESPVDLGQLVEQALGLTEPRWKTETLARGISIDVRLDLQKTPAIVGHACELREILTNLIFNAVDAMPQGGTLSFSTRAAEEEVALTISDTGTGMSEQVRRRCLEPFFTTKGERGSGLGLSMVYGIIQRHSGTVEIESEPGKGTSFILRFPAPQQSIKTVEEAPDSRTDHPLKVLVVDNEKPIREILSGHLENDLHLVETVASGSDALAKIEKSNFDLVITRQVMPGMNGQKLAGAIKKISPRTRVLLLTGFEEPKSEESGNGNGGVNYVARKPASLRRLRSAIAKAMA
jgi:signal transduction histidine kinase